MLVLDIKVSQHQKMYIMQKMVPRSRAIEVISLIMFLQGLITRGIWRG